MARPATKALLVLVLAAGAAALALYNHARVERASQTVSARVSEAMPAPASTATPEIGVIPGTPAPESASAEASPSPEAAATTTMTPAPPPSTAPEGPAPATAPKFAPHDVSGLASVLARVEEKRGGPERIEVPRELMHYEDHRRFLAVQMAATREDNLSTPHDEAALAEMILRGELVEMPPLTEDFVLYQIGNDVDIDPLTHFDVESGKDVPLVATPEQFEREDARLAAESRGRGREAAKARERRELMESLYRNPATSAQLFREHAAVTRLAKDFGGVSYDLANPMQRAQFVTRLLSFLRPPARDVLQSLAHSYRTRFARPLPIASLVRSARYQRRLARVNSNASRAELAPHTSGEAFDMSYKFMAPDEQNFLMAEVARLERQGRVEALREHNNSLHVYVFANGHPPSEPTVASFLDEVGAAHPSRRGPRTADRGRLRGGVHAMKRF